MSDNDDETGVFFDAENPDDEYDRYEDFYLETGHDPYRLFTEHHEPGARFRMKYRLKRILRRFKHSLRYALSAKYRALYDEIPF